MDNSSRQKLERTLGELPHYSDRAKLKEHVGNLLDIFPTLAPSSAKTNQMVAFRLTGTLPIEYSNAQYNIPVQMWLGPKYPHEYPQVYVMPTPKMYIQSNHRHVDKQGKCYLAYLTEWNGATSDLVSLVLELAGAFSSAPPLFERREQVPPHQYQPPPQPQPQFQQPVIPNAQGFGYPSTNTMVPPPAGGPGGSNNLPQPRIDPTPTPSQPQQQPENPNPTTAAQQTQSSDKPTDSGDIPEDMLCVICMEVKKDCCFVPCGHCCTCMGCSKAVSDCPQCRSKIDTKIKVFF
eukprot:TRINITY_DN67028_c5_g5_i2.p1 TRINITY_DN67028_c5_g5~~TRINITY_DN67028_c5_g5_i2.p1  ORF type:complete len:301 (+),score=31.73 TRINITY_DN67028_c5_g5_i2:32-904(+)